MKRSIDYPLLFAVLGLVVFGMIMISSVSVYPSFNVTTKLVNKWLLDETSNAFYLVRNISHVAIGFFALLLASKTPIAWIEKHARYLFWGSLLLLVVVLFVGTELNGAKWWIDIPGFPFSIQPVEFAKLGLVIFLAAFMKRSRHQMGHLTEGVLPFLWFSGLVLGLLALQPDFGSILIITPVLLFLYFIGGGNIRYIGIGLIIACLGAVSIYAIGNSGDNKLHYISARIDNFLRTSREVVETPNPDGKDYQTKQGLIAIGSGGFGGLGFGKSIQKFWYLPEVQWDFIFSVIVEELGFVGAFALLSCYIFIIYRIFSIARNVKDLFARYLAVGIGLMLIIQTFVNLGVNLNIVPLTGVTLPFVSYGGSSLFSLMTSIGVVLSISRLVEVQYSSFFGVFGSRKRLSASSIHHHHTKIE